MQYVWQHRLWLPTDMVTTDGRRIEVIDPGLLNSDSGPDFFNAKIKIDGRLWAGNVEIHVRASDWHSHGHDSDPAYHSVVLHVVEQDDTPILRPNGETIPQVVMPCAADFANIYDRMVRDPLSELPCARHIVELEGIYITDWLTRLAFERLGEKADRILGYLDRAGGDWGQAVFVALARALGFSTNSDPFELVALATPLRKLMRHCDSLTSIEGALFGQAGFLDTLTPDAAADPYVRRLVEEYTFMAHKYELQRPAALAWKTGRMRPHNFPHRRLATLAAMVADNFSIGYNITSVSGVEEARRLFDIELSGYWAHRFNFGEPACRTTKALSDSSVNILLINVTAPVLYAYGIRTGRPESCVLATEILQALPPEDNSIIRIFTATGISCNDALTSQAIIQLRNQYCRPRKCLYCRIGHRYFAQKAILRPV